MSKEDLKRLKLDRFLLGKLSKQNIHSVQDILSLSRLEALNVLGISDKKREEFIKTVSTACCPKPCTAFEMYCSKQKNGVNFLPLSLQSFDKILHGGLPLRNVTEITGPSGVGKTQFCLMLSVLAPLPIVLGGLDGTVIFIDTESTFSAKRLIEIAHSRMPNLYSSKEDFVKLLQKVFVYKASTSEVLKQIFAKLEWDIIRNRTKLIIIDSVASLVRKEFGTSGIIGRIERSNILMEQAAVLKFLAESLGIVVLVTNQITSRYSVPEEVAQSLEEQGTGTEKKIIKEHIVPALGVTWGHCINTRLVAQFCDSTHQQLLLTKSSVAPFASVTYTIQKSGIVANEDAKVLEPSDPQLQNILTKYQFLNYRA